ncbi:MAG: flagellar hook protein FlgE [Pseudomonadota bacterium]|nr:flagellar hook protein FlgE [Pseudomonadota bacterium]
MSFQQGLSGLNATSQSLEVIGNNIANAGTYGAKAARAEFADLYARSLGGSNSAGIGVQVASIAQQFSQGGIASTGNLMDVAINGDGFFQLQDTSGQMLYSRNGQFKLDNEGYIVNGAGHRLLGYPVDSVGNLVTQVRSQLQLPTVGIEPKATSEVTFEMNLDSRKTAIAAVPPATTAVIDYDDPSTYNNATSVRVYDAKGQPVDVTLYFQKTATDSWNVYVTSPDSDADGNPELITQATVAFDSNGLNPSVTVGGTAQPTPSLTLNVAGSSSNDAISGIAVDLAALTQFGGNFGVTDVSQDGYAPGQLTQLTIEEDGIITARYSNSMTQTAGQIELANFRNTQGLKSMGGNVWASSYASGDPVAGVPGSATLGLLKSKSLEESNVDMTAELVNMITVQRLYQANAQTIKTQDSVLQTLVSLR